MFKHDTQRGFTLIELLVVIAIIGILAATVLASLGTARSSGSDASLQSSINAMKAQAELYYTSNNNSYVGLCTSSSTQNLRDAVVSNASGTPACNAATTTWAYAAGLKASSGFFCSDSTGYTGKRTTALSSSQSCN